MLRNLRWQIALAAAGVALIGLVLLFVSNRAFEDRPARGGQVVEAVLGRPATFNPLLATSDVEIDVARLLFSGLTRPDSDGVIRPDLASEWTISPDGRVYTFKLRDAVWHDGTQVTSDDVVLTARLARDEAVPSAKHPLAAAWRQAEVEAVDAQTVRFTLPEPFAPFLAATTMGLVPAHIFAAVPPGEIGRHEASTKSPIGTGAWRLDLPGGLDQDQIRFVRFERHWAVTDRQPFLDSLTLRFYDSQPAALEALGRREVQLMGGVAPDALALLGDDVRQLNAVSGDYTLVYLNPSKVLFADAPVRRALGLAVDRTAIIQGVLRGQGAVAKSPIPPGSWAYDPAVPAPTFDRPTAENLLTEAGWVDADGDGIRDRDGRPLRFALDVYAGDTELLAVAGRIRDDWQQIGVAVDVRPLGQSDIVRALTERSYEAALYGVRARMDADPDPYPLWHSSQAESGLNFADFTDAQSDQLLVGVRQVPPDDVAGRRQIYSLFQARFAELQPALLLYHPVYTMAIVDPNLGGVQLPAFLAEPADRHYTSRDWFVRTERIFFAR